jgi:SSS family solute:Na+ symporter
MGILFVLTVIIMFIITAFSPRTSDYDQEYTRQVNITNWKYLKPVGYVIVGLVIALYISLS